MCRVSTINLAVVQAQAVAGSVLSTLEFCVNVENPNHVNVHAKVDEGCLRGSSRVKSTWNHLNPHLSHRIARAIDATFTDDDKMEEEEFSWPEWWEDRDIMVDPP